jgi:hypothetical protein
LTIVNTAGVSDDDVALDQRGHGKQLSTLPHQLESLLSASLLSNGPASMRPGHGYGPEHYNDDLVLKVPVPLWLVLVFLVRHLLLLGITFLPTTGEEIRVLRELVRPEYLIADLIALPVLLIAIRRRPQAPDWMRRLWPMGRWLLALSVLTHLVLLGRALAVFGQPLERSLNEATLIVVLLDLAVLGYLWRSRLLRDLFRTFPESQHRGTDADHGRRRRRW